MTAPPPVFTAAQVAAQQRYLRILFAASGYTASVDCHGDTRLRHGFRRIVCDAYQPGADWTLEAVFTFNRQGGVRVRTRRVPPPI